MNRKAFLVFLCLSFLVVAACQNGDAQPPNTTPEAETEKEDKISAAKDFQFELTHDNIEALKKGEIKGFPVQLGDDENKVKQALGEPTESKKDEQGITLIYPNVELFLVEETGEGEEQQKLDVPVLKAVTFPIHMSKSDVEALMGEPTDERMLQPNEPELEYDFDSYVLLFLSTKGEAFDGPYDQLYFVDSRP